MRPQFILLILLLLLAWPALSQVPRRETDNSKLVFGKEKPERQLVIRKMYSPVRFTFQEGRYIWLEYQAISGGIVAVDGLVSNIKESSFVVGTEELLLRSIVRVEVRRRGRGFLLFAGTTAAFGALLGLFSDDPNISPAVAGVAAVALLAAGYSIQKKVPIGDKFRISTELY